jgi:hypothetical protein
MLRMFVLTHDARWLEHARQVLVSLDRPSANPRGSGGSGSEPFELTHLARDLAAASTPLERMASSDAR